MKQSFITIRKMYGEPKRDIYSSEGRLETAEKVIRGRNEDEYTYEATETIVENGSDENILIHQRSALARKSQDVEEFSEPYGLKGISIPKILVKDITSLLSKQTEGS